MMGLVTRFDVLIVLLCGLVWIGITAFLRSRKKKSIVYLLFFSIFYVYLVAVLYYTIFLYQSLLFLKLFVPGLMLQGQAAGKSFNLIPLITLTLKDVRTSVLNIVMMIPFGFGLPFITRLRFKKVVIAGLLMSIAIEFLQFVTGFVSNTTFRIADINDVIFNTLGVAVGYILCVQFVRIYRRIFRNSKILKNPILRYIADRPQIDRAL